MELRDFWAKTDPFQSIVTHGIVSGTICRYLMKGYLSEGSRRLVAKLLGLTEAELADFMAYLVSLHDIGKIEYHFQCKDPQMKEALKKLGVDKGYIGKENTRHEKTGATVLRRQWRVLGLKAGSCNLFSDMVGAHHQKNHGAGSESKDPFFAQYREELEQLMRQRFLGDKEWILPPETL